jgi:hypothetical protein
VSSSEPAQCAYQTYRATRFEPAEYCETEVESEGDFCARHDDDEPDYDQIRKDRILDERES